MGGRRVLRWTGACCLLLVIGTATAGPAAATASRGHRHAGHVHRHAGRARHVLVGTYPSGVVVSGYCKVDGGAAVVDGTLTVAAHATLDATFAYNDVGGSGSSSLTVTGDVKVGNGAILLVGCEPGYFACSDDPGGTASGDDHIGGNLVARHALGVVVHDTTIGGSVTQTSGGGGVTHSPTDDPQCVTAPPGPFATTGVYSDYEDDTIGGNLQVTGAPDVLVRDAPQRRAGQPGRLAQHLRRPRRQRGHAEHRRHGNIACTGNSPAVQYGDSGATPNMVTATPPASARSPWCRARRVGQGLTGDDGDPTGPATRPVGSGSVAPVGSTPTARRDDRDDPRRDRHGRQRGTRCPERRRAHRAAHGRGGPPLLLVHGGVGQIERWAPLWDLLADHRRVTAMDRRGRGSSGDGAGYAIEDEYGDVAAVVRALAEESGRPVDVFAHSYGATCTLGAARLAPPFGGLVLYEPPGPADGHAGVRRPPRRPGSTRAGPVGRWSRS